MIEFEGSVVPNTKGPHGKTMQRLADEEGMTILQLFEYLLTCLYKPHEVEQEQANGTLFVKGADSYLMVKPDGTVLLGTYGE